MEKFTELINALDGWLWGLPMIVLLLSGVIAKETRHYISRTLTRRTRRKSRSCTAEPCTCRCTG